MNPLILKINKLFSLSFREIVFRLKEKAFQVKERYDFSRAKKPLLDTAFSHLANADRFFLSDCDYDKRISLLHQYGFKDNIIKEADQVLKGDLTLLGMKVFFPKGEGWHLDPESGDSWPGVFYADVLSHTSMKNRDVKFVWEVNRHQYLIPLAKAYFLTGNEVYAEKVFSVLCDWIDANPYNKGVNWTSSLEHAVRLFSWTWSLNLCRNASGYKKNILKIRQSVFEQAYYTSSHLSHYSSPYNHLIGEAAALFLVGSQFPELKEAQKWKKTGWSILEETIDRQFCSDGMTVEQASFYHHFTLGFYISCILLKRLNNQSVSDHVMERIQAAIDISRYLHMPDKTLPMKGDIDNARSIYFNTRHSWDFTFYQDIAVVLFNSRDFKQSRTGIAEELLWLLGDEDINDYLSKEERDLPAVNKVFRESGYGIIKDSWERSSNFLCFDFGMIAHGLSHKSIPSAAHGHADALAVDLCVYGKPFLVDGGFYTYFGDRKWHEYFRKEEAHNTFVIHGLRQAEYVDCLKWQKVVSPKLVSWQDEPSFTSCSGKIEFSSVTSSVREVFYQKKQFWIINDIVNSPEKCSITNYFNFHPDVELDKNDDKCELLAKNGNISLLIKFLTPVRIDQVFCSDSIPAGWVCKGYGYRTKASSLKVGWETVAVQSALAFIMIPFTDSPPPNVIWDILEKSGSVHINNTTFAIFQDDSLKVKVGKQ